MPNVAKFAKALYALHNVGCLNDPSCNAAVGAFIRQSTETKLFHLTTDYMSRDAASLLEGYRIASPSQYHAFCRKTLRHEHMVPTSVIRTMFAKEASLSEERIAQVLREFGLRATITRHEDSELSAKGLKGAMPKEFWIPGSSMYLNPLARYIKAELAHKLLSRKSNDWFELFRARQVSCG